MGTFVREQDITVFRKEQPDPLYNRETGEANPPIETEHILRGSIQPTLGEDLKKFASGYRIEETKTLFLHEELAPDDIVFYRNQRYSVEHEEYWDPGSSPIPHFFYIVVLEKIRKQRDD